MTASYLIDKIMNFYEVSTLTELSKKLDIGQPAITKWKKNNSIMAIKKKCRELGIYNDIFANIDSKILEDLNKEQQEEIKNSIDEDTMFHIQNLFTIAKKKNLLKELKTELSMMYLKYSIYSEDDLKENLSNSITFEASEIDFENYKNWDEEKVLDYEVNRLKEKYKKENSQFFKLLHNFINKKENS
ncbi:hypothetical protein [Aliarcobacter butzleri]|uniref:Uncharacterized protein n=1 Tax=Aliarcobacter butzleri L351 TaxID=1447259 RepID=A0A837J8V5_9BACT|nr:hypothetical protein [Aliarcobacter butzleri]KLE02924.1 hypothetical protein AF76_00220 [Aliarcobacter butzleri L351]KLE14050.1 hypothetical protein AF75_00985 [Aliarcobacter butzleri L350]